MVEGLAAYAFNTPLFSAVAHASLRNKFLFLINHPVFGILAAHTNGPLGVLGSLSQQAQIKRKKKKKSLIRLFFKKQKALVLDESA